MFAKESPRPASIIPKLRVWLLYTENRIKSGQGINYLLTYDSYVPLYNRFHRGDWITRVSGGEGALDTPGPWNGTSEASAISVFSGSRISDPGSQPLIFENLLTIFVKNFYNSLKIGPNFFLQQFKTEIFTSLFCCCFGSRIRDG